MAGGKAPKAKGNRREREGVRSDQAKGLESQRARGSDGRSFGRDETVDRLVENYPLQDKAIKAFSQRYTPNEHQHGVVIWRDRQEPLIVIRYRHWQDFVVDQKELTTST